MSKQEKIVCAAVEIRVFNDVVEMCSTVVVPCVDHDDGDPSVTIDKLNPLLAEMWTLGRLEVLNKGFITNKNRFVDPVEAMKIAVEADQVGGIFWQKVEARMLNDCGFIDRSKVKRKAIDETIKNYLEFPLKPEDLY